MFLIQEQMGDIAKLYRNEIWLPCITQSQEPQYARFRGVFTCSPVL